MEVKSHPLGHSLGGYAFVFLAAGCWALIGPLAKFGLQSGLSPQEIAFWRAAFGAACFCAHAGITGLFKVKLKEKIIFSLFGVVGIAVMFSSYQIAVREGGAALASVLLYTAPAWVTIFSRLFFAEPLTRIKLIALVLAMCGATLAVLSGGGLANTTGAGVSALGIACGLLAGFTYSLHYVFTKRYLSDHSPITLFAYCLPVGALALFPSIDFAPKASSDWIPLITMGVVCTYAAYWAYCQGMMRLSATKVAITANLEPILASMLAWWWWGEMFSPIGWLGAFCVIGAVFLIIYGDSR